MWTSVDYLLTDIAQTGLSSRDFHAEKLKTEYDWIWMPRPAKGHLGKTSKPFGNGMVPLTTPPPWHDPLLWLIMPPSLQIIPAVCIFLHVCSCWFTNLWGGSHCQKANLRILCDKWWYLSEPAVWDRVMTKVTTNGVCGTVGACKSVSST